MIRLFKLVLDYYDLVAAHIARFYVDGEGAHGVFATHNLKLKAEYFPKQVDMFHQPRSKVERFVPPNISGINSLQLPKFRRIHCEFLRPLIIARRRISPTERTKSSQDLR